MAELPPQPVRLHLYAGPAIALPAPQALVDALREVTIENGSGDAQSGFELVFDVPKKSPLSTLFLLTGGVSIPLFRIVLAVTIGGTTDVLADGVMTDHEFKTDGSTSTLHVKGKDLTAVMDIVELDGIPYPAMPAAVRALAVARQVRGARRHHRWSSPRSSRTRPIPTRRSPATRAPTTRTSSASRTRPATSSTSTPDRSPA